MKLRFLMFATMSLMSSCSYLSIRPPEENRYVLYFDNSEYGDPDYEDFGYNCIVYGRSIDNLKEKISGPYSSKNDCLINGNPQELRNAKKKEIEILFRKEPYKRFKKSIYANKPMIGMPREVLYRTIGKPVERNILQSNGIEIEQLIYGYDYYYFESKRSINLIF